ncbi:hypothetical protein [Novosphingobium sp. 9]|uniref:hypothetical protein n=1 Tax=Novosphingobium sp. 9 TaxID=2025349 RepID=UPI0021B6561F|nr:hypothetical protein [Novosphingobium sp. 9]
MTTSADLLVLVYQAVIAANTDAGTRVFRPGDWPSTASTIPQIKMRLLSENRTSIARSGAPQFLTVATFRLILEVSALASEDDAGAGVAEAAAWALKRQVEVAVINSYPLTSTIQQIAGVRAQIVFNSEGERHLAMVVLDLDLEFYEGAEDFAPVATEELEGIDLDATNFPSVALTVDLPQQ